MGYPFEQIFAADPGTPGNVAAYASIVVFAPGDETKTPIPLTTLTGGPLSNPLTTSGVGATVSFIADIEQVAWDGGGYSGLFTSYEGMRNETELARIAAQSAATDAQTAANAVAGVTTRLMPSGGTTGQVLAKTSGTNYAAGWINPPEGGGGGTSSTLMLRYTGGSYPALPSSKPAAVSIVEAIGPTYPTGIPSWVGLGPTQVPLRYSYVPVL